MAEFFVGQVMMTGFGYAPKFFAQCNGGQLLVTQNQALYSLLGVTFGGNGQNTFNLPDLRGRTPIGAGFPSLDPRWQPSPYNRGAMEGLEQVVLTGDQNPPHTHTVVVTSDEATSPYLDGAMTLAVSDAAATVYGSASNLVPLGAGASSTMGAGVPHDNMQPFQVINFNIALSGIFPSRG
jgi:microcystin-dependent protein